MELTKFKILRKVLLIIVFLFFIHGVSATPIQDLINSYSFDYYGKVIDVGDIGDFMVDGDGDGAGDMLVFNISINDAVSGSYTFYADVGEGENKVSGKVVSSVLPGQSTISVGVNTELLSGNQFNYTIRIYDSRNELVYRQGRMQTGIYLCRMKY